MANSKTLTVTITGDTSPFERALGRSSAKAKSWGEQMGVAAKGAHTLRNAVGGLVAIAGVGGLADAFMESTKAAEREQTVQASLAAQMKAVGLSYAGNREQIDATLASQERISAFAQVELTQSFTTLVRSTKDVSSALKLNALATDVARGKHMDLQSAATLVAKVYAGNIGLLRRAGIQIDKNATSTEALALLQQKFGGQAKAYGDSAAGSQQKFSDAIEHAKEALGRGFLPVLTKASNVASTWLSKPSVQAGIEKFSTMLSHGVVVVIEGLVTFVQRNQDSLKQLFDGAATVVSKLWTLLKQTVPLVQSGVKALGGWAPVLQGIAAGYAALKVATLTYFAVTRVQAILTAGTMKTALISTGIGAIVVAAGIAAELIITHWSKVRGWFTTFAGWVKTAFRDSWAVVKELAKGAVYAILQWATFGIRGLLEVASHLPFVGGKARAALDSINGYIDKWKPNFTKALDDAGAKGGAALGGELYQAAMAWAPKLGTDFAAQAGGGVAAAGAGAAAAAGAKGQGNKIAAAANAEQGIPYSWGGGGTSGPSFGSGKGAGTVGFDCSGLAVYALAQAGIHVNARTTQQLFTQGRPVFGDYQPGDLMFFEGPHPGHVAVYIGNGMVVHAPHTGSKVQVTSLSSLASALGFSGARRYTKVGKSSAGSTGKKSGTSASVANPNAGISAADAAALGITGAGYGGSVTSDAVTAGAASAATKAKAKAAAALALKQAEASLGGSIAAVKKQVLNLPPSLQTGLLPKMAKLQDALHTVSNSKQLSKLTKQLDKIKATVRARIDALKKTVENDQSDVATAIGNIVSKADQVFQAKTQHMIDTARATVSTIYGTFSIGGSDQTPGEKALADLQAQQDQAGRDAQVATDRADLLAKQQALAALRAAGVGGTDSSGNVIDQAALDQASKDVTDAQAALDADAIAQKMADLQKQADVERTAADAALKIEQDRIQQTRELQQQAMDDQVQGYVTAWQRGELTASQAQADIIQTLNDNDVNFDAAGTYLGSVFAASFNTALDDVSTRIAQLAADAAALGKATGTTAPKPVAAPKAKPSIVKIGGGGGGGRMLMFAAGGSGMTRPGEPELHVVGEDGPEAYDYTPMRRSVGGAVASGGVTIIYTDNGVHLERNAETARRVAKIVEPYLGKTPRIVVPGK